VFSLLFGNGFLGEQVDEIQIPFTGNAVAIGVSFGKVIARIEKKNGNLCIQLDGQFGQQHIFGLKAARQARVLRGGDFAGQRCPHLVELRLDPRMDFLCAH
jgi:hypothetical protein